jgi:hypothetical protein
MSGAAAFGAATSRASRERAAPPPAVGLVAAVALAALAWLVAFASAPWLFEAGRVRLAVVAVASAYAYAIEALAPARAGKVVLGVVVALVAAAAYVVSLDLLAVLVLEASVVWLVRTALYARSVIGAVAEAALVGGGVIVAVATYASTRSVATAAWAFGLVLAAGAFLPAFGARGGAAGAGHGAEAAARAEDRFERAHRAAEAALAALAKNG